jgi:hypothetical protein
MNDERVLVDWLQDESPDSTNAGRSADKIMAQLPETPQRSRWWPLVLLRRQRPKSDAGVFRESRRTRPMFSPTKVVVAGVMIFAIGGALAVSLPGEQSSGGLPGAATEPAAPAAVKAEFAFSRQVSAGSVETLPSGIERTVGEAWQFRALQTDDPRLDGPLTWTDTFDTYPDAEFRTSAARIENENGAWQEGPIYGLNFDREPGDTVHHLLIGEGDYEGLVAVVVDTFQPDGEAGVVDIRLEGFILDADIPPAPEPWTAAE